MCFVDFPLSFFFDYDKKDVISIVTGCKIGKIKRILVNIPFVRELIKTEEKGWVDKCKPSSLIVLFDQRRNYSYYAKKIESMVREDTRLILYLLNPISFSDDYKELSKRWEVWSFSEKDCADNGLMYGETFYSECIPQQFKDVYISKDVFFIGTDKGRGKTIEHIKNKLIDYGLNVDIRIADNKKHIYNRRYSRYLKYKENCKEVASSKMLLEVVQNGQTGLTLRTMEALFFNKKLITNNAYIKNSIIYRPENFFVIGDDRWEDFEKFVSVPFQPIPDGVKREFSLDRWIERLLNNTEFGSNE